LKTKQKQQRFDFEERKNVQIYAHRGMMKLKRATMGGQVHRV
jgi:hypothetical protein